MIDYDKMRAELASIEASERHAQPAQNPYNPLLRGFADRHADAKAWDAEQARRKATLAARKDYLRNMLGQQPKPSDPYGDGVRSLIGGS